MWETLPTIPQTVTEINTIIKVYGPFLGDASFTPEDTERANKAKTTQQHTLGMVNLIIPNNLKMDEDVIKIKLLQSIIISNVFFKTIKHNMTLKNVFFFLNLEEEKKREK